MHLPHMPTRERIRGSEIRVLEILRNGIFTTRDRVVLRVTHTLVEFTVNRETTNYLQMVVDEICLRCSSYG